MKSGLWTWPFVLGVLTTIGLMSALLGDGVWDALSWVTLGVPVVVCLWYGWLRREKPAA